MNWETYQVNGIKVQGLTYDPNDRVAWKRQREAIRASEVVLGGSSLSAAIGESPFTSPTALFYEMLGMKENQFKDNWLSLMGRVLEPVVRNMFRVYDGSEDSIIQYLESAEENAVRGVDKINMWIRHPDYPWFIGDLDGLVTYKEGQERAGVWEGKCMSGFAFDKTDGLPSYYLPQVISYMGCVGASYGTMSILRVANSYSYHEIELEPSAEVHTGIMQAGQDFVERVREGRARIAGMKSPDKMIQAVEDIAPELDTSESTIQTINLLRGMQVDEEGVELIEREASDDEADLLDRITEYQGIRRDADNAMKPLKRHLRKLMFEERIAKLTCETASASFKKRLLVRARG